jgi:hypothetical protein
MSQLLQMTAQYAQEQLVVMWPLVQEQQEQQLIHAHPASLSTLVPLLAQDALTQMLPHAIQPTPSHAMVHISSTVQLAVLAQQMF